MPVCDPANGRYTPEAIVVEYLPCGTEQVHIQVLSFHADVTAGDFTLTVNGETTEAITYSATTATLLTSINSALDALDSLEAAAIVATGTDNAEITLTAADEFWYYIDVDGSGLTGNTTSDPNVTTYVEQQGAVTIRMSTHISSFDFSINTETVDVTAISEYERTEIPTAENVDFSFSAFAAEADYERILKHPNGAQGVWTVYPKGKISGKEWFKFRGITTEVSVSYPDKEVVELEASGMRQGAWIVRPNSVYKPA
jgi:hypothetical protein